ncbi:SAM-dependent methyltransferase [Lichenicoccus roseus]|uniref:Class I SAM-dependent methyltransferase n=1 Tax=Lichenicoccus roseus TaxID=2683649 RepID=A0A5R9JAE5_9PROT|nr:cyclopropane-fatty-acyl-phospholipid synthase family protein [Lichenicoccus roseus]TLU73969.1 class I SAM-dependent methyltransferase [Lichenicoccus roseus]
MSVMLDVIMRRFIRRGILDVRYPDGRTRRYGTHGPQAGLWLETRRAELGLIVNPGLLMPEAYMEGGLRPMGCSLYALMEVLMMNVQNPAHPAMQVVARMRRLRRAWSQSNPAPRSRRNVAHHYDLSGRLYSLFLDRDRQYSCAYFAQGDESLDEAQEAKKHHIAAKLKLDRPGLRVLDIGCGWGGMALTLARDYGARVTGITLSTEQLEAARARAVAEGLDDRVSFELVDYRDLNQRYDRIVSVGMFEHVGISHYGEFFARLRDCLAEDGVALIHSIGRADGPGATNAWIAKYIFPGGYSPALSETTAAIEQSGLWITDIEILRLHYAKTLAHWSRRFAANRTIIASLYDERFCRMFELYLVSAELAFRRQGQINFQIQLTRDPTAVPLTRDYMFDAERLHGVAAERMTEAAGD